MGRPKKYNTEEERKEAQRAARKRWNEAHPEEVKEGRRRRQKRYSACDFGENSMQNIKKP